MVSSKKYSVIIRCYNEEKHIGRLLSGLLAQSLPPDEILVVDSGSTDVTLSIASRFPVKIIHVRKEEFSFGKSLNIGCQNARNDFLVFASAHVYPVYTSWADEILKPFDNANTALVYGKQRGNEATKFSERQVFKKWFPDTVLVPQRHPFCNNANAAIRRELWEKYPFNEQLTGLEDLGWAKTITEKNYDIQYEPKAVVIHVHDETYQQIYNRYYREALALKKIYPQEKFGRREFIKLFCSNVYMDMACAWEERVFFKSFAGIIMFRWMQFTGTYRGFTDSYTKESILKNRFYYPPQQRAPGDKEEPQEEKIDYSKMDVHHV